MIPGTFGVIQGTIGVIHFTTLGTIYSSYYSYGLVTTRLPSWSETGLSASNNGVWLGDEAPMDGFVPEEEGGSGATLAFPR